MHVEGLLGSTRILGFDFSAMLAVLGALVAIATRLYPNIIN
ncbi:MAG: hypothetical protein M0Z61_09740 [Nitrospiraceae bacterium]|nr:hypothetical protein [Nitrospiraceae bacterium]